jgi:hypothetical protein
MSLVPKLIRLQKKMREAETTILKHDRPKKIMYDVLHNQQAQAVLIMCSITITTIRLISETGNKYSVNLRIGAICPFTP